MNLVLLTQSEFKSFSEKHPLSSFYQTAEWGTLKEKNTWKSHLIGLKDNNNIVAACLLLSKKVPLNFNIFYSPRGFLIDYTNYELLTFFTKEIKKYVRFSKGIFVKIDPYLIHQERDIEGTIIKNGINNEVVVRNLKKIGYIHTGYNLYQQNLQPRWLFVLNIENKNEIDLLNNMDPKTRQIIRKNEKNGLRIREIGIDELYKFKNIMDHTSERRGLIDRPLSYYKDMYKSFKKTNLIKFVLCELDTTYTLESINRKILEKEKTIDNYKSLLKNRKEHINIEKTNNKIQLAKEELVRLNNKKIETENLRLQYGNIIVLGGIVYLIYGNEVLSLSGGSYKDLMFLQPFYTLNWEMIKFALNNGFKKYNFYGIIGDFSGKHNLFGLYNFKRGFGGNVVELIGEYDLVINKLIYYGYKLVYFIYRTIENITIKIRK